MRTIPAYLLTSAGYTVDHWNAEDEFPINAIRSVAQTPDGYLWCGTAEGLVRFDGVNFTEFRSEDIPALEGSTVTGLFCDSRGRLWAGCGNGTIVLHENGMFHHFGTDEGLPPEWARVDGKNDRFWRFAEDPTGTVWVYSLVGAQNLQFVYFQDGRFESLELPRANHSKTRIDHFIADENSIRWLLPFSGNGVIERRPDAPEKMIRLINHEGKPEPRVGRFFRLRDGSLAITAATGIYHSTQNGWVQHRQFPFALPTSRIFDTIEDAKGNFWISAAGEIYLYRNGSHLERISFPDQHDLSFLPAMIEDSEGNLWAAGSGALYRIRLNMFRSWGDNEGLDGRRAISVVQDIDERVWVSSAHGLYAIGDDGILLRQAVPENGNFWLATPSLSGGVFIGRVPSSTNQSNWVIEYHRDSAGEPKTIAKGRGELLSLLEAPKGTLWIASSRRLSRLNVEDTRSLPRPPGLPDKAAVADLELDREGRLLAAVRDHGLFRLEDERWQPLADRGELGSRSITAIDVDDDGHIWLGCGTNGLAVWQEGTWHSLDDRPDLPDQVFGIVVVDESLWIYSDQGLTRIRRDAVLASIAGNGESLRSQRFDRSDGLLSSVLTGRNTGLCRGKDGSIWVSTLLGVSMTNPDRWPLLESQTDQPPIYIENMLVDGVQISPRDWRTTRTVQVGPGPHRVEFQYTAVDLGARHSIRFRHRLLGFDPSWVDAGEIRTAVFRKLPPGSYRFEIEATDQNGKWGAAGPTVEFFVARFWWQTPAVRIGAILLALAILCVGIRRRHRNTQRRHARQEEFARQLIIIQEGERERIAAELHDGLGQNLLLIKNGIHLVGEHTEVDGERPEKMLDNIGEIVSRSVEEVRTISRNLHPFQLERLGLSKTLRTTVRQASATSGIEITAEIEDVDELFPKETEINIYRLIQEALNNAIKHSHASSISVKVACTRARMVVEVFDDGCGFDERSLAQHDGAARRGFGLRGMEERARIAGGRIRIDSSPGNGAHLRFELPLSAEATGAAP